MRNKDSKIQWLSFIMVSFMKGKIKKQFWLTKEENELLKHYAKKTCLTESGYLRMLLNCNIPKEKPDKEFYEVMNKISIFSQQVGIIINYLERTDTYDSNMLKKEMERWHKFQLDIEKRFLTPEKVPWR